MAQFEQALKKLVDDRHYRAAVIKDPSRLTTDFKQLGGQEILLLMQVWHATGGPQVESIITMCHCCCGAD